MPVSPPDSCRMPADFATILLSFVSHALVSRISNMFNMREKVACGTDKTRVVKLAHTGTNFCSAGRSHVRLALFKAYQEKLSKFEIARSMSRSGLKCDVFLLI